MNIQRKTPDALGHLLNAIDENTEWDTISFQEILRHEGAGCEDIMILKNVGKLRHTVLVAGYARGTYSVGIAVHNRWTRSVTHMAQSFRTISINISCKTLTGQVENIQVISCHIPSLVGRQPDCVLPAVQAWGETLRGARRHAIFTGMDANMELNVPLSGCVGGALPRPHSRRSADAEEVRAALHSELEGSSQVALNTFKKWYDVLEKRSDEPETEDRTSLATTWRGKIFGAPHSATLDYILADKRTSTTLTSSWRLGPDATGVPSDHIGIFGKFSFQVDAQVYNRSQGKKPIGWTPTCPEQYHLATMKEFDSKRAMTMTDISAGLARAAASVPSTCARA